MLFKIFAEVFDDGGGDSGGCVCGVCGVCGGVGGYIRAEVLGIGGGDSGGCVCGVCGGVGGYIRTEVLGIGIGGGGVGGGGGGGYICAEVFGVDGGGGEFFAVWFSKFGFSKCNHRRNLFFEKVFCGGGDNCFLSSGFQNISIGVFVLSKKFSVSAVGLSKKSFTLLSGGYLMLFRKSSRVLKDSSSPLKEICTSYFGRSSENSQ